MKALTLKEPWASLIACGVKFVENRTWSTTYRGPLLIHAGQGWESKAGEMMSAKAGHLVVPHISRPSAQAGRIVGLVDLVDCVRLEDVAATHPNYFVLHQTHLFGPWCWILDNVRQVESGPPIKGRLGLWNWTGPEPSPQGPARRLPQLPPGSQVPRSVRGTLLVP